MMPFIAFSNESLFVFYLVSNLINLALLIVAVYKNTLHRYRLEGLRLEGLKLSPFTPPISVLVPAHNEEMCIVANVLSLLDLDYPQLEVIVVNDGSRDQTMGRLREAFGLHRASIVYVAEIGTAPVTGIYRSLAHPQLLVLDKQSAGSKADAINAGINAASSPYVCVVDADSILEKDSLSRIMAGVISDPERVVAVGGIVRILNGSKVQGAKLKEVGLPRTHIEMLQIIEYLRAFLVGREAWAAFNLLPIISGAFGIFRRDLLLKIGGFRADAVGEDFELVVRLHRYLQDHGMDYHINFIPDPTCWTEAPSDYKSLARQRARWHKGLLDTLWSARDMLFRKRYGRVGSVILPYMWLFECFAPLLELLGYVTIVLAAIAGCLSQHFFLQFLLFGYAFATLISVGSVLLEEMNYRRYVSWRAVGWLLIYCLFEHFPYRQMTMFWRLRGIWEYLRGDLRWNQVHRTGASASSHL
ncbi:MAG: glycosyltransferase [Terriglobales bacterium]|jgi:cellulose synthase/poly-beta-1,6-N-acetylglucosamine synthase-like glycosyltransferase